MYVARLCGLGWGTQWSPVFLCGVGGADGKPWVGEMGDGKPEMETSDGKPGKSHLMFPKVDFPSSQTDFCHDWTHRTPPKGITCPNDSESKYVIGFP